MREIIFRGKRIDDGKWTEGNLIKLNNGEYIILPFEICKRDGHHLFIDSDDSLFVDEHTIIIGNIHDNPELVKEDLK